MLAQDDPEKIQILRDGEPVLSSDKIKTLSYVDAWNTMRDSAREEFVKRLVPDKLRKAIDDLKRAKSAGS